MILAGEDRDPTVVALPAQKLHLDDPLPMRYLYWAGGVLKGDLGESQRIRSRCSISSLEKLPVTLELALLAIVIALSIGVTAGIVSAVFKDTVWDYAANVFALVGLSTPNFWLGIMLILLFSVTLGWLPASGYVSPFEDLKANLAAMIMPAFVLGNAIAAVLMRHTRSAMLQVLNSDYVRTARAKGLDERVVVLKHALRNALIAGHHARRAGVRHAAVRRGADRAGVHDPGFGKLIVDAVFNRDYAVVQGVVLFTATAYIALNLLADLAYFRRQPAAAGTAAGATWTTLAVAITPVCRASSRRDSACCGGSTVGAAPCWRWASSCSSSRWRFWRRRSAPLRSAGTRSWSAVRKAAERGALVRHRRNRPRRALARHLRHPRIAPRRRGLGVHFARARRADRPARRLRRRLGRRPDLAHDRRDARLPVPDPGHRAGGIPGAEPHQRHDRDRHLGHAGVHPADAGAGACGSRSRTTSRPRARSATRTLRIALRHILPNVVPPLIVQATLAIAAAVIAEASLSFLGLGQQPPAPSWGSMLNTAKNYIDNAPWMAVWPGLSIFLLVLSFNLLGDGLRDAFDPRHT